MSPHPSNISARKLDAKTRARARDMASYLEWSADFFTDETERFFATERDFAMRRFDSVFPFTIYCVCLGSSFPRDAYFSFTGGCTIVSTMVGSIRVT